MSEQLKRLARPFPKQYVTAAAPGKYGSYVSHDVINQALLAIVGPFSWSAGDWVKNDAGQIEGCTGRLTLVVDGRTVVIEEPGDCEQPGNWKTQGARMKDAASDAFKRCAMRAGLGLHLWNKSGYFLYDQLNAAAPASNPESNSASTGSSSPEGAAA